MLGPSTSLRTLFYDIESDGLLYDASTIWCIVAYQPDDKQYFIYHIDTEEILEYPKDSTIYTDIDRYTEEVLSKYILVGHNIIGYDRLLLEKLHGYLHPLELCIDTFVMSSLFYPDRDGHSLAWWGDYLRLKKGDHSDWDKFSSDLLVYCVRDVDILPRIHRSLLEEAEGWDWTLSLKIENSIADLMARQELHGVLFDVDKAEILLESIEKEVEEIEVVALEEIPKKATQIGATVNKVFKKDGAYTQSVIAFMED